MRDRTEQDEAPQPAAPDWGDYEPPTVRSLGGVTGVTQQTGPGIPGGGGDL